MTQSSASSTHTPPCVSYNMGSKKGGIKNVSKLKEQRMNHLTDKSHAFKQQEPLILRKNFSLLSDNFPES